MNSDSVLQKKRLKIRIGSNRIDFKQEVKESSPILKKILIKRKV